jgi:hypothetical protein
MEWKMKVEEHGNILSVIPDGFESFWEILTLAWKGFWVAIWILIAAAQESVTAVFIAFIIIVVIGWFLISIFTENEIAYLTNFDKDAQKITMTLRSPWTLWMPQKKTFRFKNLITISLSKVDEKSPKLYMLFKGDTQIPFAGSASATCAEKISKFLKIPLRVELDNERITHMPWVSDKEGVPFPTPCAKCGAPLPAIEPGMYNVKCSHCGMTMVITWSEGEISYKAA